MKSAVWTSEFEVRTKDSLRWLKQSFDATNQQGSAASFVLMSRKGPFWNRAYPETTGYIIETMLGYHKVFEEPWIKDYALNAADWLLGLQYEDGAFPAGYLGTKQKSIFNTGQILFGLLAAHELTNESKYLLGAERATRWLANSVSKDGSWDKFNFVPGYSPTYYTRVIWPMMMVNDRVRDKNITDQTLKALTFYKNRIEGCKINGMAFHENQAAFTHTIAYTLRGFLECAHLLNDDKLMDTISNHFILIFEKIMQDGRLAGRYDVNWNSDLSFECLTGNAQMTLNFARMFELTGDNKFFDAAILLWDKNYDMQSRMPFSSLKGGIAGSKPIWGPYMTWEYPNWAAKFYLDAYLIMMKLINRKA